MKTCTKCGETKPLSEFHSDSSKVGGYRNDCKPCVLARRAEYVRNNKEKVYASDLASKRKHSAKKNINSKAHYARHREKVLANQRLYYERIKDRKKTYAQEYFIKNKAAFTARVAKRRAATQNATPAWADFNIIQFLYVTRLYLTQETGFEWHVDHVVPLQGRYVCGLHVHNNLRVVPATDNLRKSNSFTN